MGSELTCVESAILGGRTRMGEARGEEGGAEGERKGARKNWRAFISLAFASPPPHIASPILALPPKIAPLK
jgi:hypothetical protein